MFAEQRFWTHVTVGASDECWLWKSAKRRGYGTMKVGAGDFGLEKRRDLYAHRIAYFITNGRWPEPMARHTCDNPPCCNPKHILAGSNRQNMQDKVQRGRSVNPAGEASVRAKLTDAQANEIRTLYRSGSTPQTLVAERYGVTQTTVSRIVRGKRYAK